MKTLFLAILFSFLVTPLADATSFIQRPFPESIKEAPAIVRGRVGVAHAEWADGNDGFRRLYTYYPLEIKEVFKGNTAGSLLQMRELGGEKDHVGMQVAGSAQFTPGEDVVVFLGERNTDGSRDVWGLMMGKFNVERDEKGEEVLTGPGLGSAENDPGAVIDDEKLEGQPRTRRWSLDGLRKIVAAQKPEAKTPAPTAKPVLQAPPPMTTVSSSAKDAELGGFQPQRCGVAEPESCASPTPVAASQKPKHSPLPLFAGVVLLIVGGTALAAARRRLRGK